MNFDLGDEDKALQQRLKELFDATTLARLSQMPPGDAEKVREELMKMGFKFTEYKVATGAMVIKTED